MFAAPAAEKSPSSAKYRSFLELHAAHELGNEKTHVRVAVRMRAGRRVHRHAGHRRGEVGPVIEVEAAQVVLIGFALAAVLAHDQAGNGLEHLARAHHRTCIQLGSGDRSLAGSSGDAHEIRRRVLDVRDVSECARPGHDDVGAQRQRQRGVGRDRRAVRDRDRAPKHTEIEKPEGELGGPAGHIVESVCAGLVRGGRHLARVEHQIDRHARQACASLIEDAPGDPAGRLRAGVERDAEEKDG